MLRRLALLILLFSSAPVALAQSSPTATASPDGWNPEAVTFELSTRTPRRGEALRWFQSAWTWA